MSWLSFTVHAGYFKLRDRFLPPAVLLAEADIQPGHHVLDYGCGAGSYAVAAASIVGPSGRVVAADVNPFAVNCVRRRAARQGLGNIDVLQTNRDTGLQDASMDIALLYDALHAFAEPQAVLAEIRRVLKPDGLLSLRDHHMSANRIVEQVTLTGAFVTAERGARTHRFRAR